MWVGIQEEVTFPRGEWLWKEGQGGDAKGVRKEKDERELRKEHILGMYEMARDDNRLIKAPGHTVIPARGGGGNPDFKVILGKASSGHTRPFLKISK